MIVRSYNPSLWVKDNRLNNNSLVAPSDVDYGDNGSDGNNSGAGVDQWMDRINGGLSIYEQLRCSIKPNAPGCYRESNTNDVSADNQNQTMLILGLGIIILLVIVLVIFAFKK